MTSGQQPQTKNPEIPSQEPVEQLDIRQVLSDTKKHLEELKTEVEVSSDHKKTKEYLNKLVVSFKSLDANDKALLQKVEESLNSQQYNDKNAIEQMIAVVEDLESKAEQLSKADKEKIADKEKGLVAYTNSLDQLRQTISVNPQEALKEAKEKAFLEVRDELEKKWWCPKWLSDKVYTHLVDKHIRGEKLSGWKKVVGGLFGMIAGFAMGSKRKDFFKNIDNLSFSHISAVLGEKADKWKDALGKLDTDAVKEKVEKAKEKLEAKITPEQLEKDKTQLKQSIKDFVEKKLGKKITTEQLERVMSCINLKNYTQELRGAVEYAKTGGKEGSGNFARMGLELMALPFGLMTEIIGALRAEGIISTSEMVFEATGGVINYGLKGFKLFGTGLGLLLGKISRKDMGTQIAKIYDKSPDEAKQVLAALIYKTPQNPIFKGMLNFAEGASKTLMTLAMEPGSKIATVANISDVMRGNINTGVQNLQDMLSTLKNIPGLDKYTTGILTDIVPSMEKAGKILEVSNKIAPKLSSGMKLTGSQFESFVKSVGVEIKDLPEDMAKWIHEPGLIDATKIKRGLGKEVVNLTGTAKEMLKGQSLFAKWGRELRGFVKGEANPAVLIDEIAAYLDDVGRNYGSWLRNESVLMKTLARYNLIPTLIEGSGSAGKVGFHVNGAKTVEELGEKLKFLAKESPSTAKFLLGKSPIFLVTGMALTRDGTPTEKVKNVLNDLKGLIPFYGPFTILEDSTGFGKSQKLDLGQATVGGILMLTDGYHIIKPLAKGNFAKVFKYISQPVVDVYEVGKFGLNQFRRAGVLVEDFAAVSKTEGFWGAFKGTGKAVLNEGRLGKFALFAAAVGGLYVGYDYFFGNTMDETTQKKLAEYENDPNKLDRDIKEKWTTLPQEEKNDYFRAALLARGGFSPAKIGDIKIGYDAKEKQYSLQIPSVINGDQRDQLKAIFQDAITDLEPGTTMRMQIAPEGLVEFRNQLKQQFADLPAEERASKMEEYVKSMGYEPSQLLS